MNWVVFLLALWITAGLEVGLRDAFALGGGGMAPSFVVPVVVFICLSAPARTVAWACLVAGLVMDLLYDVPIVDRLAPETIPGPHAIGYLLAGQLVLVMRGSMVRRNPLTTVVLAVLFSGVVACVVSAFFVVRTLAGDPLAIKPIEVLVSGLGASAYTAVTALLLAPLLLAMSPVFGFVQLQARMSIRRGG